MPLPKTITKGDVAELRKKRTKEFTEQFDRQRDFAEYEAARTLWVEQRDAKACREAVEKLLARRPEHCEAQLLMAELLLSEGDAGAALQTAQKALSANPNDAQVHYTVALTLDAQGKNQDALPYYERAAKMDPRNGSYAAAYQAAQEIVRGEVAATHGAAPPDAVHPGTPQKANASAGDVTAATYLDPLSASLPTGMPPGSRGPGGPAGSVNSSGITERGPTGDLLRNGQKALADGTPQAALDYFRQAVGTKPDNPHIPISAAAVALRANRPELAVELLTAATKRFPNSAAIYRMLGAAHYRTGDYKSSQGALQQALSLDKSSALSYLLLGCTLAKLGQNEAAEAHFRQARTLDPKYNFVR
jgi:tetratricopeptide (TPR) repeat protein